MTTLLSRFKSFPLYTAEVMAASFFISLLNLALPVFVIQLLNRFVSHGFSGTLYTLATGVTIAIVLQYCFQLVRTALLAQMNEVPDRFLAAEALKTMSAARFGAVARFSREQTSKIMNDIRQVQAGWEPANITPLLDIPFVMLYLLALAYLSPLLALIAFIGVLFGFGAGAYSVFANDRLAKQLMMMFSRFRSQELTALNTPETIRAFNASGYLEKIRTNALQQLSSLRQQVAIKREQSTSAMSAISGLQSVILYSAGAVLVVNGSLSVGVLIGANILASRSFQSVARLFRSLHMLRQASESRTTLEELKKLPLENARGIALKKYSGRIRLQDAAFRYVGGSSPLFESLSLSLQGGQILVIIGNNGTGKTTLIRLIAGLIQCSRGDILVDDINLKQVAMKWWREQLIYLPQEPDFFFASIRDNITLDQQLDDARFNQILQSAGLRDFLDKSAEGTEAVINDPASIPVGIRKRIALARALVPDGQLVLFDEPTVGLDQKGCAAIYELLNKAAQEGKTIIVSTNDPYIMQAAHILLDLNSKPVPLIKHGK